MATKEKSAERTEEEKLTSAPIKVILGGKPYDVKPLVIRESREWRKKAGEFQAKITRYASVSSDDPEAFEKAMAEMLTTRIDQAIDLFFAYAKDLDRDEIEAIATDAEVAKAFEQVVAIAFPFE